MRSIAQPATASKAGFWTGHVLSGLSVVFLLFDSLSHLAKPAPVVDAFARIGFPLSLSTGLGVLMLGLVIVYVIPRTAILGAILLTGYLGGAVAIQLRAGSPAFECAFPIIFGVLIWAGPYLRDERLRALIPLRR